MQFAAALKRRRIERGLKVGEAASLAGVDRVTWSTWESGRKRPLDASLAGIARALGWTVDEVLAKRDGTEQTEYRFASADDQAIWDTGERMRWTPEQRMELIRMRQQWEARARGEQQRDGPAAG